MYLRFNIGWVIFVNFFPKIWVMKTYFLRRVQRGCIEKTTLKSGKMGSDAQIVPIIPIGVSTLAKFP